MEENKDVIEIDLREIFAVLLRWWWLLLASALVAGFFAFTISKFIITPVYESETRIVILDKESDKSALTYSDLQMGTILTKDYAELICSRYVIEQVIETFALDATYEEFSEVVHVETPSDTRIIDITVENPDPVLAKELVDEVRNVAAVKIKEVMDIEAVNVVDEGNIADEPSNPNVLLWTFLGFLLGGIAAAAVVLIRFLLDDTIKSSEDIEKYLHLSTLALIPISITEAEHNPKTASVRGRKEKTTIPSQKTQVEVQECEIEELDEEEKKGTVTDAAD